MYIEGTGCFISQSWHIAIALSYWRQPFSVCTFVFRAGRSCGFFLWRKGQNMKKIYDPKTKQYYLVNEILYTSFAKEATRIRKYEQYHGHCCCPYTDIGRCDGCCLDCPYRITDTLSLDQENEYGSNLYDLVATNDCPIDHHCAEKQLLSLVIGRLRELDAEADKMLMIWVQEGVISDREMARRLGRKQSTFAKQIKRIRMELRIICKL